ncbi:hypothetical protein KFE96_14365 [Kordiimonas sp. SCSIO 12603]|uniref:hypothetical protein n=1 Tax=Kordiimonas sp. SCSIO 12603 TaxID=2829596 RepID=UPI0021030FAF|nr:hypothetical protein [Kordiimonas sp. SCSIO 12603]UTW57995.1 hypothetical protein KFE96_14365 [Kordiimonas sp. SCSIO 12603]
MPLPHLTLHIGHPKSGSTTLQSFLFQNWKSIAEQGLHMPSASMSVASSQTPSGNTLQKLEALNKVKDANPIRDWITEIQRHQETPRLLISSEIMAGFGFPKLFAQAAELANFQIIYYIRRQDKLLLSAWKQWALKRGLSLDELIDKRINDMQPNFIGTITRWRKAIPNATFHIRFIDPEFLYSNDLINDFCQAADIDQTHLQRPKSHLNMSPDGRILSFLSRHSYLFKSAHDHAPMAFLQNEKQGGDKIGYGLTQEQFDKIYQHYEPQNQELLKLFHPEMAGTPVIKKESAPIWDRATGFSVEEERSYLGNDLINRLFKACQ